MSFTSSDKLPRSLQIIAAGRAISVLGDELALLTIAFRARDSLGHWGVAGVLIAGALPLVLFSAHAGLVVDRVRTRVVLVIATTLQAGICLGLAWSPRALLIPLVALLACATAVSAPAWQALVPTMVSDEQLPSAYGLLQSSSALAGVAGPVLGGVLVATYGFSVPLLLDAGSFLILLTIFVALGLDRVPLTPEPGSSARRAATEGFRVVMSSPLLRSIVILLMVFVITIGVVNVCEIFFITTSLHAGPFGYGMLGLCAGVGTVVTSALSGSLARRWPNQPQQFVVGCAILCIAVLAFGFDTSLVLGGALCVAIGVGNALLNVNAAILLTRLSVDESRGRVMSAAQGIFSASSIASLALGGLLLTHFAPSTIIIGGGTLASLSLFVTAGPVLKKGAPEPDAPILANDALATE